MASLLELFIKGAGHFLLAFGLACIFLAVFKWIYQRATPHDESALIAGGNVAAAIILSGAVIGFALPVASALSQTGDIVEFAMWAALAGIIQIIAFLFMRRFAIKDLRARIEDGNIAVAIYLAAMSVSIGLINAASMTY
jgi:putative membrane protein